MIAREPHTRPDSDRGSVILRPLDDGHAVFVFIPESGNQAGVQVSG